MEKKMMVVMIMKRTHFEGLSQIIYKHGAVPYDSQ